MYMWHSFDENSTKLLWMAVNRMLLIIHIAVGLS